MVLAFPNGLAGLWREHVEPRLFRKAKGLAPTPTPVLPAHGAPAE